jgi:hypothetical protein
VLDAIVVTLAVGPRYVELAGPMLAHHAQAGNAALVVTDEPAAFSALQGVEALPWQPEAAHVWHSKRHAVRVGLERALTVYYMDADYAPQAPAPQLTALPPGLHSRFWRLPLVQIQLAGAGPLAAPPAADWLDRAAAALGVEAWHRCLWWWGDSLWAISRDEEGRWTRFCDGWDRFAAWSSTVPAPDILRGDGVAMSFAAHLAGWGSRIHRADFRPILAAFQHLELGEWRKLPSPAP